MSIYKEKNQFIDDIWDHLKSFKTKLDMFSRHLTKNDLPNFPSLNSISSVNKDKFKSYENGLKNLHFQFERRFRDFYTIQTELVIFTIPFNINCEVVRPD